MPNNLHNDHKLEVYPVQTIFSSPNPIFYPGLQEMTLYIAVARVLMLPMIISGVYDKLFFFLHCNQEFIVHLLLVCKMIYIFSLKSGYLCISSTYLFIDEINETNRYTCTSINQNFIYAIDDERICL